jgi:MoaD family protein
MYRLKLYATLRPIVGGAVVSASTPAGATVQELVEELLARWPDLRPEMVDTEGRLLPRIHIFVNGKDITFLNGVATTLPEGGNVDIFPPVGGG